MLTAFLRAFRTPDLRKKLLFTVFIIAVFRLGQQLPTPGVSESAIRTCTATASKTSLFQLLNLFSGGSITKLTVFALGRAGQLIQGCTANLIPNPSVFTIATMVIIMTSGTAVIMWLGELITDKGVGNGMSIMIFTQIIAVVP